MRSFPCAIALLLLASCGEGAAPPPPQPAPPPPRPTMAPPSSMAPAPPPAAPAAPPAPAADAPKPAKDEPVDSKGIAKSPQIYKKFVHLMEEAQTECDQIGEDLKAKKNEAAIKQRLARIRKAMEEARALHYLKDPDVDENLDTAFEIFLMAKLKNFQEAAWIEEEDRDNLYRQVKRSCQNCHGQFRDE